MGLITVNYSNFRQLHAVTTKCDTLTEEFQSVFDTNTLGCMNGPVTLRTDDATRPVKCPPRRVPIAMQTKLRYELEGLVDLKVIIPVAEPTVWCSQMSKHTKKSGRLRICIDPIPLNEVMQWETYPLPTIDYLFPELANAKVKSNRAGLTGLTTWLQSWAWFDHLADQQRLTCSLERNVSLTISSGNIMLAVSCWTPLLTESSVPTFLLWPDRNVAKHWCVFVGTVLCTALVAASSAYSGKCLHYYYVAILCRTIIVLFLLFCLCEYNVGLRLHWVYG